VYWVFIEQEVAKTVYDSGRNNKPQRPFEIINKNSNIEKNVNKTEGDMNSP
jgi:hypothetical protein